MVVLVPTGSDTEASTLARALVERRLVACAQIMPIRSCYCWHDQVVEETEYLLLLKTRRDRYAELEACVTSLHSYDVPEIIALPVMAGLASYLNWIDETVQSSPAES
ncbi:MAG: divalent-cation tolerance protein CutA [Chloroflexaceae bacterium]|nr:divalent-cation tolerance protein CutA [Chloroflexaceae bacterium]